MSIDLSGRYVILDEDNDYIGVDEASAGYPFKATHPGHVKFWRTVKEAAKYIAVCQWNKPNHGWTIHQVNMTVLCEHIREFEWSERNV